MKSSHTYDVLVGANIRTHRVAAKLSQAELGQQIGVTFQQIQEYERGAKRVGAGRLVTMAHVLHVPVTAFFECANMVDRIEKPAQPAAILSLVQALSRP